MTCLDIYIITVSVYHACCACKLFLVHCQKGYTYIQDEWLSISDLLYFNTFNNHENVMSQALQFQFILRSFDPYELWPVRCGTCQYNNNEVTNIIHDVKYSTFIFRIHLNRRHLIIMYCGKVILAMVYDIISN